MLIIMTSIASLPIGNWHALLSCLGSARVPRDNIEWTDLTDLLILIISFFLLVVLTGSGYAVLDFLPDDTPSQMRIQSISPRGVTRRLETK